MAEQDVGLVPAGAGGRLVGVVPDRDIVVTGSAQGQAPSSASLGELSRGEVVTLGAGDSFEEALGVMAMYRAQRVPVIDGYRLVGIVSQVDMAQEADDSKAGAGRALLRVTRTQVASMLGLTLPRELDRSIGAAMLGSEGDVFDGTTSSVTNSAGARGGMSPDGL